jgi:stalled ribosome alternative rescue factor ArfA
VGSVAQGIANSMVDAPGTEQAGRGAENKESQNKVNSYMSKMKTDMDFTSFSPSETKTMRNFLMNQRNIYANAAKKAAEFEDTTDPNYMLYVDQMQNVNNSFTNLASQLKSYKEGKLEYAKTMQEGLYSDGNSPQRSKEASIIYGFYDSDGDGRSEARYDAPFQIQDGGNIAFNVGGQEISYNSMEEPFLKDTKFLNGLNTTSENAYNSGLSGNANNPYSQDSYNQQLSDALQNENTLRSIIYDFNAEAPMSDIGNSLDNGSIDIPQARELVKQRLLQTREDAYEKGKSEYKRKQRRTGAGNSGSSFSNSEGQYFLSNGKGDVELYHFSHPGKKVYYNVRPVEGGGFEIGLKGGNRYEPLGEDNAFNIDITKINFGGGSEGADDIGYNKELYDSIKNVLGIKGDPTPEERAKIMEEYNKMK